MNTPSGVIGTIRGPVDGEDISNLVSKGVVEEIIRLDKGVFSVSFGEQAIEDYVVSPHASNDSGYSASLHARVPSQGITTSGFQLEVLNDAGEFVDPKLLMVSIHRVPQ